MNSNPLKKQRQGSSLMQLFTDERDQAQYQMLSDSISKCELAINCKMSKSVINCIAEHATWFIQACECNSGEMLILHSSIDEFIPVLTVLMKEQ